MVWECLTSNGVGDLVRIDGIILIHYAIPSVKRLIGNSFTLQEGNYPNDVSLKLKIYLDQMERYSDVQVIKWPPKSPDLNIKSLWDYLDSRKQSK